ncbi:protein TIFY 4B isoform X4 [Manihot esculenta]|uniref:Uncharacterized protein n=1 Tax=Manihot esculenta TaxID=3983 RepID=A0ACB7I164_MANES|nr:protein TIFY 4B isoform X4 [Manihot esculenta]KAG8658663.1 hypothetical protein MANES_03G173500v8 [Manihot esculenta]
MDAGVTSFRSILEKPLTQLTEEDISQLTREDCRKYLKEKGMRRPSWNKSQAIQQVISLKALLEPSEDSGAGALRKILVSKPPATSNSVHSIKEPSDTNNNAISGSADETAPSRQNDSPKATPPGPLDSQPGETDNKDSATRCNDAADGLVGQMTIFYCGKVNVYDGIPPDKIPSDKHGFIPPNAAVFQSTQTDVEGQANRRVSLQRYLEKKKDRGRFKGRKNTGPTSSSLEVYLNHHVRMHTSSEQTTRSSTSSPSQPGVPPTLCSSAEDQSKISCFSVDLNEDVREC